MAFGPGATRNLVDLDAAAFAAWRARRELRLPVPAGASAGPVLVRHRGLVAGTGFLRVGEDGEGRLESQFPKAWVREEPFPDDD
jgi:NOL1/NOP2/fmu family ribosome biogenesis protein